MYVCVYSTLRQMVGYTMDSRVRYHGEEAPPEKVHAGVSTEHMHKKGDEHQKALKKR